MLGVVQRRGLCCLYTEKDKPLTSKGLVMHYLYKIELRMSNKLVKFDV